MNPWTFFLICPMLKQILAERDGTDWSDKSVQDIRQDTPSLTRITFEWFLCCDQSLRIIGLGKASPSAPSSDLQHHVGKLCAPFDKAAKSVHIATANGPLILNFNRNSKSTVPCIAEGEQVHIFTKQRRNAAKCVAYLVDDTAMRTIRYFFGDNIRSGMLEAYIDRPEEEQKAFAALVTQEPLRRSTLRAMGYLATVLLAANDQFSSLMVDQAATAFNDSICKSLNCLPLPQGHFQLFANNLFRQLSLLETGDPLLWDSRHIGFFGLFAVLSGWSVWHAEGLSTDQILTGKVPGCTKAFSDIFPSLVPLDNVDVLLDMLIAKYPRRPSDQSRFDQFLFHILLSYQDLKSHQLSAICDILFSHSIYNNHANSICKILAGPHGERFRTFVLDRFEEGYRNGVAQYHFCAATIINCDRAQKGQVPYQEAINAMNTAASDKDFLLNATCLSMALWLSGKHIIQRFGKTTLTPAAIHRLATHLKQVDLVHFPLAANAVSDLVIHKLFDPTILDQEVRMASLKALGHPDLRRRAEEILTLIPYGAPPLCDEYHQLAERLTNDYLQKFEESLTGDHDSYPPELLLAALCHLGAWDSQQDRQQQLNRVCDFFLAHGIHLHHDRTFCISCLISNIFPQSQYWQPHNTPVSPMFLGQVLSGTRIQELRKLSIRLGEPNAPIHVVTDPKEAVEIIRHLKPYAHPKSRPLYPTAGNLVSRVRLDIDEAGSFIILSWFQLLCIYGEADLALSFYKQHKDILDMPHQTSTPYLSIPSAFLNYRAFRTAETRVAYGIQRSIYAGHTGVLSAFMNSEFRPITDSESFISPCMAGLPSQLLHKIADIYGDSYGTRLAARSQKCGTSPVELDELVRRIDAKLLELRLISGEVVSKPNLSQPPLPVDEIPIADYWRPSDAERTEYPPRIFYDDQTIQQFHRSKTSHTP